jgi:hypothetical protein
MRRQSGDYKGEAETEAPAPWPAGETQAGFASPTRGLHNERKVVRKWHVAQNSPRQQKLGFGRTPPPRLCQQMSSGKVYVATTLS